MKSKPKYIFVILLGVINNILVTECIEFDRNLFGVEFTPYVNSTENEKDVPTYNYTLENLKTMLQVVSTKFTRIVTPGLSLLASIYKNNHTYYNPENILIRTAEAAALINAERKCKSVTVVIGADAESFVRRTDKHAESEFLLAVEAAQISNSIYSGTVTGIQLNYFNRWSELVANKILYWIKQLRTMTASLNLKIGLNIRYCDQNVTNQVIINSDFLVYEFRPSNEVIKSDVKYHFSGITRSVNEFRSRVQQINNNIIFMWHTYWSGSRKTFEVKYYWDYWKEVNKYAIDERTPVWLNSAFDNPMYFRKGWWKLERNDLINNISGYIENYSGKPVYVMPNLTSEYCGDDQTNSSFSWGINSYTAVVIIAFTGGFTLLALTYFIFTRCRKTSRSTILTEQEISEFKIGHHITSNAVEVERGFDSNIAALHMPYDVSLEIPKARFEILWDERLGRGEFGLVYKAVLRDGHGRDKDVVVKLPKQDSISVALKGLLSEIKILAYLGQHPNIVSICGSYTAELDKGVVYLALELCPLGSLKNHLKKLKAGDKYRYDIRVPSSSSCLTEHQRNHVTQNVLVQLIRWSNDIASGMEHLEKKNVLHADLATRNILLMADKTAKVTDFGLSRRLYEYSNYKKRSQAPLPWRWLPLESLRNHEFSLKSDVWSYGVTLWEIFSFGDLPFPERSWNDEFMKDLENGLRLCQPTNAPDIMYDIMKSCWNLAEGSRPNFVELQARTKHILEKEVTKLLDFGGDLYSDVVA